MSSDSWQSWTAADVAAWMRGKPFLKAYADIAEDAEIDGMALCEINNEEALKEIFQIRNSFASNRVIKAINELTADNSAEPKQNVSADSKSDGKQQQSGGSQGSSEKRDEQEAPQAGAGAAVLTAHKRSFYERLASVKAGKNNFQLQHESFYSRQAAILRNWEPNTMHTNADSNTDKRYR